MVPVQYTKDVFFLWHLMDYIIYIYYILYIIYYIYILVYTCME